MQIKNWVALSILTISVTPIVAFAADNLEIWNNTTSDISFKINQGDCSATILGKDGLVKAQNWNSVDIGAVTSLCGNNATNCVVDLYTTGDCSGPIVGSATMDTSKGISAVDSKKVNGIFVSKKQDGRLFSISIIGGPAAVVVPAPGATSTTTTTTTSAPLTTTPDATSTTSTTTLPALTTDVSGDDDKTTTITKPEPLKVTPSPVMSPLITPDSQ